MYCDSGIAEYRHSVDGLERIDSVLFLTDLQEEEVPELLELARVAILDSKSRRYLAWPAGRHVQELRWFVSVDLKYIMIKHISESPDEWSLMQGPQGLRFKFPFKGSFHEIIRDLRDYLEKDDPMKTRLTSRKTVGDGKLVKRVSLRDSGISNAENFAQKLEECFMNPQRASDDELVCLFFMNRNRDEFDQTINGEVRELIVDRFESREWEGRGFFELSEVSINELEHRRERGRKNLRKFVSRFPGWLIGENGTLEHEVWGSQAFSFLRKFSDDELVELALVYYGAGMKFDSRTKVILSVVQERL